MEGLDIAIACILGVPLDVSIRAGERRRAVEGLLKFFTNATIVALQGDYLELAD